MIQFSAKRQIMLLSLLLAATLWVVVALESVDQTEMPVSAKYENIPEGLVLTDAHESTHLVRIEAARILLVRQKIKGITAIIDLSGIGEGETIISEHEMKLKLAPGVKVTKIMPYKVELKRQKTISRSR